MIDLTDRYLVANDEGKTIILDESLNYNTILQGSWVYVVGGIIISTEDLEVATRTAWERYQSYEDDF